MGRNAKLDQIQMAQKQKLILETGFRVFSEHTIESVAMTDIAREAGIGIATLYRYYSTKLKLVLAVSVNAWKNYVHARQAAASQDQEVHASARDEFEYYLNSFIDLYRNHRSILRFNQFFNVYLQNEKISSEEIGPYTDFILTLKQRFLGICQRGEQDGTMKNELPADQIFSITLHLMLAAVTRYAVGLVYNEGIDPEEELQIQKRLLLKEFAVMPEQK
ncbi:MAG: TetR/AcrR family transcriptional regulator [Solobacterium sp.]|nr:TetR/AcrR family transcriptional regulator [Solobacterium sp.]